MQSGRRKINILKELVKVAIGALVLMVTIMISCNSCGKNNNTANEPEIVIEEFEDVEPVYIDGVSLAFIWNKDHYEQLDLTTTPREKLDLTRPPIVFKNAEELFCDHTCL